MDPDVPYLLLTPGPLTTSRTVKQAMMRDYCTWDDDYNHIVSGIRTTLVELAGGGDAYTAVLMQGSGTFAVEATIGTAVPADGKLLVIANGAYGRRMAQIAQRLRIDHRMLDFPETEPPQPEAVEQTLADDERITHVALVHCETTTGQLNPAAEIGAIVADHGRALILDAMSSFGGIPMTIEGVRATYLISSANKCLQGVPGFGFVIARRSELERTEGRARSLSLDLFDQWREMERHGGKWRYTSPTHTVRAFAQALVELDEEGGIERRARRYCENHQVLVSGMQRIGFRPLLPPDRQSPIITSFLCPAHANFTFRAFYDAMKRRRFVIYPGKVSDADTFRIGTIGHVFPDDVRGLLIAVEQAVAELRVAFD